MKFQQRSSIRFLVVVLLLAVTSLYLKARSRIEYVPRTLPLSTFPTLVGERTGQDQQIDEEVRLLLGPGEFLDRMYTSSGQPWIGLFLAFFPSQQAGDTIHSPKNCIPAAGWTPTQSALIRLRGLSGTTTQANLYVVQKGLDRLVVIYWYQAHGRVIANEYWARLYLVLDAIRMNRTDGSLVRITTPILDKETKGAAERRATEFAEQIIPTLDTYIPR